MSAYGHSFLSTAAFDRIAAEGVRFTNAFTTNPKCAPSRASILTGRHTWQLEEACNHWNNWPAKFPVYTDVLADAGYHVGFTGKGWGPGDWQVAGRTCNPAGPEYDARTLEPPSSTISRKDYAANFTDFLDARSVDADGEPSPFCFWYGGHEPHRPYEEGEGSDRRHAVATDDVPAYLPTDPTVMGDLDDYAREIEWFDSHLGRMIEELESRGELDDTIIMVTSDNGMPFPRVKGQMYDYDFRLPFAALWRNAPQRRSLSASTGTVLTDMISFTDIAPTLLEAAGIDPAPAMTGRSFLSQIGAVQSGRMDASRDRVCMGREGHDVGRENDLGYPVRCIRTDDYLYVWNIAPARWPAGNPETGFTGCDSSPTKTLLMEQHARGEDGFYNLAFGRRPEHELYAVRTDPECMNNLADDPDCARTVARLQSELEGYLRAQNDPRILGLGDVFESYAYVGSATHSWRALQDGSWKPQPY